MQELTSLIEKLSGQTANQELIIEELLKKLFELIQKRHTNIGCFRSWLWDDQSKGIDIPIVDPTKTRGVYIKINQILWFLNPKYNYQLIIQTFDIQRTADAFMKGGHSLQDVETLLEIEEVNSETNQKYYPVLAKLFEIATSIVQRIN